LNDLPLTFERDDLVGGTWREQFLRRVGAAPAVCRARDRSWSGDELVARAGGAVEWLERVGVDEGVPVPALLAASPNALALTVGGALWNRPVAPLGPRLTVGELRHCVEGLGATHLVTDPDFAEVGRAVADRTSTRLEVLPDDFARREREVASSARADELVGYLHTSGTTGLPKAVPIAEAKLARRVRHNATALRMSATTTYATAAGFHHIAGLGMILVVLGSGGAVAPMQAFSCDAWRRMIDLSPTHALLVPTQIEMLLDDGALEVPTLEVLQYGASPIHPDTLRAALEELPRARFVQIYGQTEGSPITMLDLDDHVRALAGRSHLLASSGRAVPGLELELLDPDDQGVGEVRARAEHLFVVGRDGWMSTGDLGRVDEEGYLFLAGRRGDRIIRGGENVYPLEVERVLEMHPGVGEAAVVGFADRRYGERIAAFVTHRGDGATVTDAELVRWCRERLAPFKIPERWITVDALPRNAAGKLMRRSLEPVA
jgi:acyl-CoA synthetase (AMP-forming)/AMP-acid ligase II